MKRVYLEICNACDLNCPFCSYEKGSSFMTLEDINRYTDQIRPFCNYLYLHILGEPLMHPDFEKIMDMMDRKGFHIQLVTNGTLLKDHPDLLQHQSLRKLSISVHSMNYSDSFPDYFDQIDRLIEKEHDCTIELRFYKTEKTAKSVNDYKRMLIERFGSKQTRKKGSYQLDKDLYLYEEELFRWPDMNDPIISHEGTCHGGIDMIAINHEGTVTLCCLDPQAHNRLGDLKKDTLADILSSEKYLKVCEDLKNGKIDLDLCARCQYRLRFSS